MTKCYVGRCKCGEIMAAVIAEAPWMTDPAKRHHYETVQVAKDVADFVREGLTIDTIDSETVRLAFGGKCKCQVQVSAVAAEQGTLNLGGTDKREGENG